VVVLKQEFKLEAVEYEYGGNGLETGQVAGQLVTVAVEKTVVVRRGLTGQVLYDGLFMVGIIVKRDANGFDMVRTSELGIWNWKVDSAMMLLVTVADCVAGSSDELPLRTAT